MKGYTVGQLAKTAQVNVETVRYYERRGLVPKPPRNASGYRQYPQDAAARIRFIKRAKELGFSLKEISELLCFQTGPSAGCGDVKKQAKAKLANIEAKIRDLERMRRVLTELVAVCDGSGPASECPILHALITEQEQ